MKPALREHILEIAATLFTQRGFTATGVDLIVDEGGIAKKTLYTYFGSKEALVVAVLERAAERERAALLTTIAEYPGDPRAALLGFFSRLAEEAESGLWTSCPILAAASEFPINPQPARTFCRQHAAAIDAILLDQCKRAGAPRHKELAADLALTLRGGMVCAMLADGAKEKAARLWLAEEAADRLLEMHGVSRRDSGVHMPD